MMKRIFILAVAAGMAGCTSHIVALREVQRTEEWVPDSVATAPATDTAPATSAASAPATGVASAPATMPGHVVVKVVDPNRASRFVYKATYDNVWKQASGVISDAGFTMDRQDYRLGAITTFPLTSAQIVEFWKPQHVNVTDALENTINSQRRYIKLTISNVEGKADFYEISIQVIVERETNPSEQIGGPVFVEGSGFGRNALTLQSDYATSASEKGRWMVLGHDPDLERKLMDALFNRI